MKMPTLNRLWNLAGALALGGIVALPAAARAGTQGVINCECGKTKGQSGKGAAPDSGKYWNSLGTSTKDGNSTVAFGGLRDSNKKTTRCSVALASSGEKIKAYTDDGSGNNGAGNPSPHKLMDDYFYGNDYTLTVTGLAPGAYILYVYAHGNALKDKCEVSVNAANGGATAETTSKDPRNYRNINDDDQDCWVRMLVTVGDSGTLIFTTSYLNGFQIVPISALRQ